jgi:hypothetical protein
VDDKVAEPRRPPPWLVVENAALTAAVNLTLVELLANEGAPGDESLPSHADELALEIVSSSCWW